MRGIHLCLSFSFGLDNFLCLEEMTDNQSATDFVPPFSFLSVQ